MITRLCVKFVYISVIIDGLFIILDFSHIVYLLCVDRKWIIVLEVPMNSKVLIGKTTEVDDPENWCQQYCCADAHLSATKRQKLMVMLSWFE